MNNTVNTLRLVGAPGTNKVMAAELSRLAVRAISQRPPKPDKAGTGGLVYPYDRELALVAARYHRTATRVLWDLYASDAPRLEPLYDQLRAAAAADDRAWAVDGATISVTARNVGAFAAGERQVVGAVKNAIIDGAAERGVSLRVDPARPDVHLVARMHDDVVTVSIDLAGVSMTNRGYRTEAGTAPLREHLAAVLLMLARFDARSEILVDPMCGSGTIAIEGALMARAEQLWVGRQPSLLSLPEFSDAPADAPPLFADTRAAIIANDSHAPTVDVARRNVDRAGVTADVAIRCGDFRTLTPDSVVALATANVALPGDRGLILVNPPYGERLDDESPVGLYRDLSRWCREFSGWRAAFLVANQLFEEAFGGRPRIKKPLNNGPLRGYFYMYDL